MRTQARLAEGVQHSASDFDHTRVGQMSAAVFTHLSG